MYFCAGITEFECRHEGPTAFSTTYDGATRPRFPLVYDKPEVYDQKQKDKIKSKGRKPDFMRTLLKVADEEEQQAAGTGGGGGAGQLTDRSQLSSIHAY